MLAARAAIKGDDPDGTFQIDLQAARQAVVWLSRPSEDLRMVCDLAGCDMDAVLARGEELLLANRQFANWLRGGAQKVGAWTRSPNQNTTPKARSSAWMPLTPC